MGLFCFRRDGKSHGKSGAKYRWIPAPSPLRLCSPLRPKQRGFRLRLRYAGQVAGQAVQALLRTSLPYVWRTSFAGMTSSNKMDFCFLIKSGFPFKYKSWPIKVLKNEQYQLKGTKNKSFFHFFYTSLRKLSKI